MSFQSRKTLPHEVPSWVKAGSLYFFTQCLQDRTRVDLVQPDTAQVLLAAAQDYHDRQIWFLRLFMLMPVHLHALISFPSAGAISAGWRNWKRYTAKGTGIVWRRDFFEHRIRSDESWELKARYIRENPVRKGLVAEAGQWPWILEP